MFGSQIPSIVRCLHAGKEMLIWGNARSIFAGGTVMLRLIDKRQSRPKCDGSTRREFLQVGALALGGLTLPNLLQARAAAQQAGRPARNISVILLFLDGGAPQHETFDPKPDAPQEYRSLFGTTQTSLTGVRF